MRARSQHTAAQTQSQASTVVNTPALRLHSEDREGGDIRTNYQERILPPVRESPVRLSLIITQKTKTRKRLDLVVSASTPQSPLSPHIIPKEGPRLSEKMLGVPAAEQGPAEI